MSDHGLSMSMFATKEDYNKAVAAIKPKPIVHYSKLLYCKVGFRAEVVPVDHSNHAKGQYAVNGEINSTSTVLSYDADTGVFETRNTIYKPEETNG